MKNGQWPQSGQRVRRRLERLDWKGDGDRNVLDVRQFSSGNRSV